MECDLTVGPATIRLVADAALIDGLRGSVGQFVVTAGATTAGAGLRIGRSEPDGRDLVHAGVLQGRYRRLADDGLAFWDGDFVVGLRLALAQWFPGPRWLQSHAAAVRYRGGCVVALGRSGAGKSTLATHAGGALLSDEMVLIDVANRRAWGLPIRSSSPREPAPLDGEIRAFVTLRHAPEHELRPIPPAELCGALMESLAATPGARLADQLDAAIALAEAVPGFELSFRPDASVGPVLESLCPS